MKKFFSKLLFISFFLVGAAVVEAANIESQKFFAKPIFTVRGFHIPVGTCFNSSSSSSSSQKKMFKLPTELAKENPLESKNGVTGEGRFFLGILNTNTLERTNTSRGHFRPSQIEALKRTKSMKSGLSELCALADKENNSDDELCAPADKENNPHDELCARTDKENNSDDEMFALSL